MFKKKFPSLASLGSDGNTAFLRAARAGHLDKVLEHLKNNVDINTCNANGLNALHLASKDGHIQVVQELLKRGANVDSATKKGNTALHIASLAGQEEVVKLLVEHGAAVNVQSQNGFTPLYMAAQENHDNVVKFLLANGANQSLATEDGFTPLAVAMQQGHDKVVAVLLENDTRGKVRLPALHIAAKKDDCKAAALLLQSEHNPDVTSKSGFTPLHIASHYGNEGIANLLLTKGADVNYSAKHNITPLHVAAKWGKSNMVALLLDRGANIEAKTRDGLTPLHCAARSGHEQVVDMLLERGAPISAKTKNGLAPLHMSSQGDHVDAARILLYHRAPVDDVTVDYLTALHVASHCGHVAVARLLLDRKADPNARALNGFTPLHIACKKNRIKVVELLLKHGASIEATTESGLTPLHVASFMGCMNIVIYLVQNEANPNVTTVRGETPLHLAARANQTDIIRILLRNGAKVDARAREQQTPLHIASRLGNVDIVMLLLQHGASVDSTTKDLYTALHIASKEGQDEVASVLLENGASLEATTKKGFTPLHLAAKYGNMKVAKLLLQRDAPVDAQGKQNGVTPLHVASHYDHQNVALLLLDKGASPHATAKNGHTPLHIAARKNQMDIATTLLEYGAKANSESKAGFTPLHLAAQEGHTDMASLLIEHDADVNHKAKNGLTPLHLCAQEDRVDVGSVLIKNKADIDATTKAGYTPLHVASHFGQMGMVKLLLANGASVIPTTAVNYTPLHQASQQGHNAVVVTLLEAGANPNSTTNQGQTALSIAQKLGYISVVETLKGVTESSISPTAAEEKYKVVAPETMQETFMSDSEDEGGEDTLLRGQSYHYLTVDEMKSLGDDSLPIDVTRDERLDNRDIMGPPTAIDDTISPQHIMESYSQFTAADNIDITKQPLHVGFLVSFLVDARGGAMRGCRHSGVRVIVPPRRASMPLRVTCRYLKRDKMAHPPPLMEGEALASRILELGPVGAKFLGPVMIEVPHFGSLRGKEREIVILRSDNGETWREHTFEASDEAIQDILSHSFEKEELSQMEESSSRTTRILTTEFPHYLAVVSRVRQEVHAIGPEGGMVSSTVVPQVQAVFPQGALTKKIKVGLQAQPVATDLTAKLLGNRVAVSPIVTVEPRRRKFHKPITLTIPLPQAANKGMINQYSGDAPTLRLLCSITGGTTRAQWEDVTGSTPLTFVNDCVSFTTTVSARFWLMDCRNISEATKMATELYREAIHVPFMAKFVVFAKRVDPTEARLRVFCMTDDKEDKTLEHQEQFTEVAKSRDVEVLEGKLQYVEFAGNLVPVTKSGEQLKLIFRAFKENRLPFTVRVKDPHADAIGRTLFMREPKVLKGDAPQHPICILNIVLPENIIPESGIPEHDTKLMTPSKGGLSSWQRLSDISNLVGEDWVRLASQLGLTPSHVNHIKTELCESSVPHQALAMLKLWIETAGNKASAACLEDALRHIGREDIIHQCTFNMDQSDLDILNEELSPLTSERISKIETYIEKDLIREPKISEEKEKLVKQGSEKDDGEERKYVAEEKEVEEVKLSVSERRREIEKRLSQDTDDKVKKEQKAVLEMLKPDQKTVADQKPLEKKSPPQREEVVQKEESLGEKETSEEKAVSPEPSHLSFDQKRKTFELGMAQQQPVKPKLDEKPKFDSIQKFINEEQIRDDLQELMPQTEESAADEEEQLSFQEKRLSFEKGLAMKKPGDKMAEIKKTSQVPEEVEDMEKKIIKQKIISEVYPSQKELEEHLQEIHSPKVSSTPPPSPAEFIKETAVKRDWQAAVIDQDETDPHAAMGHQPSHVIIGSPDSRNLEFKDWPIEVIHQTADFLLHEHLMAQSIGPKEHTEHSKPTNWIESFQQKTYGETDLSVRPHEEKMDGNVKVMENTLLNIDEGMLGHSAEPGQECVASHLHMTENKYDSVHGQEEEEDLFRIKTETEGHRSSSETKMEQRLTDTDKSTSSSHKKKKKNKKKVNDAKKEDSMRDVVSSVKERHRGAEANESMEENKQLCSVSKPNFPIKDKGESKEEQTALFLSNESDQAKILTNKKLEHEKENLATKPLSDNAIGEKMVSAERHASTISEAGPQAETKTESNPSTENKEISNLIQPTSNQPDAGFVSMCPQLVETSMNLGLMGMLEPNLESKTTLLVGETVNLGIDQIIPKVTKGKEIADISTSEIQPHIDDRFKFVPKHQLVSGITSSDSIQFDRTLEVTTAHTPTKINVNDEPNKCLMEPLGAYIKEGEKLSEFLDEMTKDLSNDNPAKCQANLDDDVPMNITVETKVDSDNKTQNIFPMTAVEPNFDSVLPSENKWTSSKLFGKFATPEYTSAEFFEDLTERDLLINEDSAVSIKLPKCVAIDSSAQPVTIGTPPPPSGNSENWAMGIKPAESITSKSGPLSESLCFSSEEDSKDIQDFSQEGTPPIAEPQETGVVFVDKFADFSSFDDMISAGNKLVELLNKNAEPSAFQFGPWVEVPSNDLPGENVKLLPEDAKIDSSLSIQTTPKFADNFTDLYSNENLFEGGAKHSKLATERASPDESLNQKKEAFETQSKSGKPARDKLCGDNYKDEAQTDLLKENVKEIDDAFAFSEGTIETDPKLAENEEIKPYVTTPSFKRRGIGGSQRLSREERPVIRDVSYIMADDESSDEESDYIVTEPSDLYRGTTRKVNFADQPSQAMRPDERSPSDGCITIEEVPEQDLRQKLNNLQTIAQQTISSAPPASMTTEQVPENAKRPKEVEETLISWEKILIPEVHVTSTEEFDFSARGESKKTETPRKEALESQSQERDEGLQDSRQDLKGDSGMEAADISAAKK